MNNGDLCLGPPHCNDTEGTLLVCYNNNWGYVCDDGWNDKAALVVCRNLGFPFGGEYVGLLMMYTYTILPIIYCTEFIRPIKPCPMFDDMERDILLDNVECYGNESTLLNGCHHSLVGTHDCNLRESVKIKCSKFTHTFTILVMGL